MPFVSSMETGWDSELLRVDSDVIHCHKLYCMKLYESFCGYPFIVRLWLDKTHKFVKSLMQFPMTKHMLNASMCAYHTLLLGKNLSIRLLI